jgi:hypothetical protein
MERAREWKAGMEGVKVKAGASVEAMTADRSESTAERWRSAAASSPGTDSAGSAGAIGAGGGTVTTVRGLAGGVLTILRERKEIFAVAVAVAAAQGRGVAADLVLGIALGDGRRRGPWTEESGVFF